MVRVAPAPRLKRWGGALVSAALLTLALRPAPAQAANFVIAGQVQMNSVGVGGVAMNGLPGNPLTDLNGAYGVLVPQGWSGTVRPAKTGYVFSPSFRDYSNVQFDLLGEDYTATALTYKISGQITSAGTPVAGAVVYGLPGNPATSVIGQYNAWVDYGWSGTATPVKVGLLFQPPSRTYANVTHSLAKQDYDSTTTLRTISGRVTKDGVGLAGVALDGFPGPVVTDANGYYSTTVGYGFSGLAIPSRAGATFEPPNRAYTDVTVDQVAQDYVATLSTFTVEGHISAEGAGLAGVALTGFPGNPVTDVNGDYLATVEYGWAGTVAPAKPGFSFDPANRVYVNVVANLTDHDYVATAILYRMSGQVTENGLPLFGVPLVGLPGNPVTLSSGRYNVYLPYGWSGTFAPQKAGYSFNPASRSWANVARDHLAQNFAGTHLPGPPTLLSVADTGNGQLHATWFTVSTTPAQFLGFVWDIYVRDWVKNWDGAMWAPFPATDTSGDLKIDLTGGYHVWMSAQYADASWYPCDNPWTGILYSGAPHQPRRVAATAPGALQATLTWRPEIYGTSNYLIAAFDTDQQEWATTVGPSGSAIWQSVFYGSAEFNAGAVTLTMPSAATYYIYIVGVAWDGTTLGEFSGADVSVP
ncbi:MAG: hypothetical protein NTW86_32395 [Candidatus Sumerlaeota bacterium]|nr:hypothetical protein [Candidatus Sumerlaeota bacterium]